MLCQLTGQDQADTDELAMVNSLHAYENEFFVSDLRGLDLSGGDGRLLVVCSQLRCLSSDALEDIVDKRVQDGHGTVGDTGIGVNLLQDWRFEMCQFSFHSFGHIESHQIDQCENSGKLSRTSVDVRGVSLLAGLGPLLLVARGGGLLASILLLRCLGGGGGGLGGGLLVSGLGRHFESVVGLGGCGE